MNNHNIYRYLIYILLFISFSCGTSKKVVKQEYFTTGIDSKTDCISKHGSPDLVYKNEFKRECWGYYDSVKSVNSICFYDNDSMATSNWMSDFRMPDTTELIVKTEEWRFLKFYCKSFQINEPQNGEFHIYIIPSFFEETVLTFNENDSVGNILTANDNIWRKIYRLSQEHGGLDSLKLKDFKWSSGYKSSKVNVSKLNELLKNNPIDTLGSIKKKGISILDGTSIYIKSNRNGKIYYSELAVVPWYDNRYETIKNEIITGYNI